MSSEAARQPDPGTVRLVIDLIPTDDDRVEGTVLDANGAPTASFSGWLELLTVLEEVSKKSPESTRVART